MADWLDSTLVANLGEAFPVADAHAAAKGLDLWAVRDRLAFVLLTESGGGYIYANDGRNTSNSPNVTPDVAETLRQSMDPGWLAANGIHYDRVGSNGRSTGPCQQISADVGGGWGDMAGTMRMATSCQRFLNALVVTDNPVYRGNLVNEDGSTSMVDIHLSSPIAADVLRVQQPLASEAQSSNYGAANVAKAQDMARDPRFSPAGAKPAARPPADVPMVLQSNADPRPHLFMCGARATQLKSGASTEALRAAGVPVAQVTPADWDQIRARWEVQPVPVKEQ